MRASLTRLRLATAILALVVLWAPWVAYYGSSGQSPPLVRVAGLGSLDLMVLPSRGCPDAGVKEGPSVKSQDSLLVTPPVKPFGDCAACGTPVVLKSVGVCLVHPTYNLAFTAETTLVPACTMFTLLAPVSPWITSRPALP